VVRFGLVIATKSQSTARVFKLGAHNKANEWFSWIASNWINFPIACILALALVWEIESLPGPIHWVLFAHAHPGTQNAKSVERLCIQMNGRRRRQFREPFFGPAMGYLSLPTLWSPEPPNSSPISFFPPSLILPPHTKWLFVAFHALTPIFQLAWHTRAPSSIQKGSLSMFEKGRIRLLAYKMVSNRCGHWEVGKLMRK